MSEINFKTEEYARTRLRDSPLQFVRDRDEIRNQLEDIVEETQNATSSNSGLDGNGN